MGLLRSFMVGMLSLPVLSSGCAVATVDEVPEMDSDDPSETGSGGTLASGGTGVVVVTSGGGTQSASSGGTGEQATGGSESSDGAGGDESSGGGDGTGGSVGSGGLDGAGGSEGTGGTSACTTVSSCGYSSGDIGTGTACWTIPAIGKNWELSSGAGCEITNNDSPVTASALQAERSALSAGTLQFEGCDNDWAAWTCW